MVFNNLFGCCLRISAATGNTPESRKFILRRSFSLKPSGENGINTKIGGHNLTTDFSVYSNALTSSSSASIEGKCNRIAFFFAS